jgi:hypothetical protein
VGGDLQCMGRHDWLPTPGAAINELVSIYWAMNFDFSKLNHYKSIYIKLNVCLYILYANLQFYSDLDEILYT